MSNQPIAYLPAGGALRPRAAQNPQDVELRGRQVLPFQELDHVAYEPVRDLDQGQQRPDLLGRARGPLRSRKFGGEYGLPGRPA